MADRPLPHLGLMPDHAAGAFVGCECETCREGRLADPDRITYTALELARAWTEGWRAGWARGVAAGLEHERWAS